MTPTHFSHTQASYAAGQCYSHFYVKVNSIDTDVGRWRLLELAIGTRTRYCARCRWS